MDKALYHKELIGSFNDGWYGGRLLTAAERLHAYEASGSHRTVSDYNYDTGTNVIIETYLKDLPNAPTTLQRIFRPRDFSANLENVVIPAEMMSVENSGTYSIITPFYKHIHYFKECALSVAKLMASDKETSGVQRVEWVICNDDPNFTIEEVRAAIPLEVLPNTVIISDGVNKGISHRLNEAIKRASGNWILFVDCDDKIEPVATAILDHYIKTFPSCRYMSSAMVDIDAEGETLRFRRHEIPATMMFHKGMLAGHLKAVRRDLFDDVGLHSEAFTGCQDYDVALKALVREPVLLIPEYLYSYRWHSETQSVDNYMKQARIAECIRSDFVRQFASSFLPTPLTTPEMPRDRVPLVPKGICFIRTQGRRLDLLAETLASLDKQDPPIDPCVLVHGDVELYEEVKSWVEGVLPDAIVLNALDLNKKRGYPLNVGLDYLRENSEKYGFFCFLDDDDILYPLYSSIIFKLLEDANCDVAYGQSNKRVPWEAPVAGPRPLPLSALVAGNFIPIHCYCVRTEFLMSSGVRVREDMHYLEDWDFLLALLDEGANFQYTDKVICEYRIIGDGNREKKNDPTDYEKCRDRVFARGKAAAKKLGMGYFFDSVAKFNFENRAALDDGEIGHLLDGHYFFELGLEE